MGTRGLAPDMAGNAAPPNVDTLPLAGESVLRSMHVEP
jgi:hypothetical protein